MYTNVDFETFIKSVSAMTGFTGDQIKTLLAYRDVKSLNETTATDLTEELNRLRAEMIKVSPSGFLINGPRTPSFPMEHLTEVAGRFSLEEVLLMIFIDCPDIKIMGEDKIDARSVIMGRRRFLAAGMYERGLIPYPEAFKLSGFMEPRGFYGFLNERASARVRSAQGHVCRVQPDSGSVPGPGRIRATVKGNITHYALEYPNTKILGLFPNAANIRAADGLRKSIESLGTLLSDCMNPMYIKHSKELLEQETNICKFTQIFYGETEAAKLAKFLILALSEPYFDKMLGQQVASGHRALTLREIQFSAFLYFRFKDLEHEAFEAGTTQAHSRLINMIIAHAYECHIIKANPADKGHYRTAEGERLYNMLKAEDIPLKGNYKDLIDGDALAGYRELSMKLNADEQSLFMAVRFPDFIRDPEKVINGEYRSFESQRINAIIDRRKLAVSMYEKQAVSMELAAALAGVNLEDFRYIQREIHAGEEKRKSRQEGKEVKS